MKTVIKVLLEKGNGKKVKEKYEFQDKDHFEAVRDFNENILPLLKIHNVSILVLSVN